MDTSLSLLFLLTGANGLILGSQEKPRQFIELTSQDAAGAREEVGFRYGTDLYLPFGHVEGVPQCGCCQVPSVLVLLQEALVRMVAPPCSLCCFSFISTLPSLLVVKLDSCDM